MVRSARGKNRGKFQYPLVSIVILNYNGREYVKRCLDSVSKLDYPNFEIIFVDNASTDGSLELVRKLFGNDSRLKIVCNNKNLGYAEGSNVGANMAKGKFVIFLNNDIEIDPCSLKELVEVMEGDSKIGAAQGKIITLGTDKIDSTGGFIDYNGWSYIRGKGEIDRGQYNKVDEVFFASSPIVRKELFDLIGGFDPSFFFSSEETDLCWRIRLHGYKVVYVPTSPIYHVGKGTIKKQPSKTILFHALKNNIAMLVKNYGSVNVIRHVPKATLLVIGGTITSILRRNMNGVIAHFKALAWNLLNLKYIWTKRVEVQSLIRKVSDKEIEKFILKKPIFIYSILKNRF